MNFEAEEESRVCLMDSISLVKKESRIWIERKGVGLEEGLSSVMMGTKSLLFLPFMFYVKGLSRPGVWDFSQGKPGGLSVALGQEGICPDSWCLSKCQGHPMGGLGTCLARQ